MAAVGVVTDSTASLGPGLADRAGMIVVPLQVVLDGASLTEVGGTPVDAQSPATGVANITGAEVARALRSGRKVTTSRPSAETFAAAYRYAATRGWDEVVSVHLSREISGTHDAAVNAAKDAPIPVTVLDTGTVGMALGYAALAGADRAAAGAGVAEVVAVVERRALESAIYFSVDSLEYLRRGGRIGAARALLGSALAVKPLLTVTEGVVQPCARVRTRAKAVAKLEELAFEAAVSKVFGLTPDLSPDAAEMADGGVEVDLAVHHLDDLGAAEQFAGRLTDALHAAWLRVGEVAVTEVSAVLGVHVGPGMLGVVVSPRVG